MARVGRLAMAWGVTGADLQGVLGEGRVAEVVQRPRRRDCRRRLGGWRERCWPPSQAPMARSRASGSTRARTRRTVASPGGCQTPVRRSRRSRARPGTSPRRPLRGGSALLQLPGAVGPLLLGVAAWSVQPRHPVSRGSASSEGWWTTRDPRGTLTACDVTTRQLVARATTAAMIPTLNQNERTSCISTDLRTT
jgi:hypothetical protein